MHRRTYLGVTGGGLLTGLAGCFGGSGQPTGDYDVGMSMSRFRPEELTVAAGTTVVWHNTSSHSHTVTAFQGSYPDGAEYWASGGHDSEEEATQAWNDSTGVGTLEPDDSYEHTFAVPGTYTYYCIPHLSADMVGKIVVEDE